MASQLVRAGAAAKEAFRQVEAALDNKFVRHKAQETVSEASFSAPLHQCQLYVSEFKTVLYAGALVSCRVRGPPRVGSRILIVWRGASSGAGAPTEHSVVLR